MKKILIIEDDANLQEVYKTVLSKEGYEVTVVGSGHDGLSFVRSSAPDLVLLDIMLPGGMNGFDVLEQIKLLPETKHIPVLVLTNLDSEENVAKSIGAEAYLVKVNTQNSELVAKVKQLLGDVAAPAPTPAGQ